MKHVKDFKLTPGTIVVFRDADTSSELWMLVKFIHTSSFSDSEWEVIRVRDGYRTDSYVFSGDEVIC